jgi:hypothetical protein
VPKCPASEFIHLTKYLCCEKARQTRLPRDIRVHYDLPVEWAENQGGRYGGRHKEYPIKPLHEVARFCETHPTINVWWYTRALEDLYLGRERGFGVALVRVGTALGSHMRTDFNYRWDPPVPSPTTVLSCMAFTLWHDVSKCPDPDEYINCPCDVKVKAENFRLLPDVPKDRDWEKEFREHIQELREDADEERYDAEGLSKLIT